MPRIPALFALLACAAVAACAEPPPPPQVDGEIVARAVALAQARADGQLPKRERRPAADRLASR